MNFYKEKSVKDQKEASIKKNLKKEEENDLFALFKKEFEK